MFYLNKILYIYIYKMNNYYKIKYNKYKKKYLNLKGGKWNCSECTFLNNDLMEYCEMCNTPSTFGSSHTYSHGAPASSDSGHPYSHGASASSGSSDPSSSHGAPAAFGSSHPSSSHGAPAAFSSSHPSSSHGVQNIKDIILNIEQYYDISDTFIIFTTGMADIGIANFWFSNSYINHLLKLIPQNFINIIIYNFDPNYPGVAQIPLTTLQLLSKDIEKEPSVIKNPRYKKSTFINYPFPFSNIKFEKLNHLLIDFAHIFKYDIKTGIPFTSNHYKSFQSYSKDIIIPHLNSVYFGYLGSELPSLLIYLSLSNFIIINSNGKSTNYIQKMAEKNIVFNSMYPYQAVTEYINKILDTTLIDLYRKKKYDNILFFDQALREAYDLKKILIEFYIDSFLIRDNFIESEFIEMIKIYGNEYFIKLKKPLLD